ncbi:MAG: HAD-IA family hydrolase [Clostridia bacterium]|nr:HAD-IA family hydrolase [Clostridia bacterium]
MKYKAILFDLDGTLLYTLDDLTDSVNYILKKYGYSERSINDVRCFVGNGLTRLIELAFGESRDDLAEIAREFKAYYATHSDIKTKPYAGVDEMLAELSGMGIKMAVVTNKVQSAADILHEKYFKAYMPFSVGDSAERQRKPSPESVFFALKKLGVSTDECLYVGDSEVDMKTAENAHVDCALVTWGYRDVEFLRSFAPAYLLNTPCELISIIKGDGEEP